MNRYLRYSLRGVFALAATAMMTAAAAAPGTFDPRETFAPLTLPDPVNAYRSADGSPGPGYWQNGVDYEIHATLDVGKRTLSADEIIRYTNNSPDVLPSLWLHLDQNIYRRDARAANSGGERPAGFTDGYILDSVDVNTEHGWRPARYVVSDTRMQLRLPEPLAANGGSLQVRIHYHYSLPGTFGGRTGWAETPAGDVYDVAQWFPRLAVFDDLHGWD